MNAVAPGSVLTERDPSPRMLELRHTWAQSQAIPKVLDASDVVGTVVFLLSDASRYVTGQTIVVDGGTVHN